MSDETDECRRLIAAIRGVNPDQIKCDVCGNVFPSENMMPEEGGEWWCYDCVRKWEEQWNQDWCTGQPKEGKS